MDYLLNTMPGLLQHLSMREVGAALRGHGDQFVQSLLTKVARLEQLSPQDFYDECALLTNPDERLTAVVRYLIAGTGRSESPQVGEAIGKLVSDDPTDRCLYQISEVAKLRSEILSGLISDEELSRLVAAQDCFGRIPGILGAHLEAWTLQWFGYLHERRGNFQIAAEAYRRAIAIAEDSTLAILPACRIKEAGLLLVSGQFRGALRVLNSETLIQDLQSDRDERALVHLHLLAAESALCMKVAAKASHALGEAKDLLDGAPGEYPYLEATLILLSAQLDTLWGNDDEGIHLFEHAVELFEAIDPPYYPGVLNAKIELIEFALRKQDYDTVFDRLGQLLEEAEERGCIDARSRLLAFHARLFIDDMAPAEKLQAGYDDLVTRLHLMNNPRLTFLAYADLYAYARKRLSDREQQFWLMRLRGLQRLLDRSCYQDLYGRYVLERYRHEIESGLMSLDPEFREEFDDEDDDDGND